MTIYVKLDLADPAYCDGCPVRRDGRRCRVFGQVLDASRRLRPQACIEASAEIEYAVAFAAPERSRPAGELT